MKPNDEWFTAHRELEACRRFAGLGPDSIFDLDPCCSRSREMLGLRPTALQFFTPEEDGLSRSWTGRVFCNPPYSEIGKWTKKGMKEVEERRALSVTFLLPANRTEQDWFQELWYRRTNQGLMFNFLPGRRGFIAPNGELQKSPRFGLVIVGVYPG